MFGDEEVEQKPWVEDNELAELVLLEYESIVVEKDGDVVTLRFKSPWSHYNGPDDVNITIDMTKGQVKELMQELLNYAL